MRTSRAPSLDAQRPPGQFVDFSSLKNTQKRMDIFYSQFEMIRCLILYNLLNLLYYTIVHSSQHKAKVNGMTVALNVEQQHGEAECQRSPKPQGIFVGQEVVKNCNGGSHKSQSKGQNNHSLQESQYGMPRGQEGDAFPTVPLCAVQLVDPQAVIGLTSVQQQRTPQSPLLEEVQNTGEAASEGELALEKEEI